MSLQEDLQKNRRVFALLTDGAQEYEQPAAPEAKPAKMSYEEPQNTPVKARIPQEESESPPSKPVFSLYTKNEPEITAPVYPENIEYPVLSARQALPAREDVWEAFSNRLEIDARRFSQSMDEEEFF